LEAQNNKFTVISVSAPQRWDSDTTAFPLGAVRGAEQEACRDPDSAASSNASYIGFFEAYEMQTI